MRKKTADPRQQVFNFLSVHKTDEKPAAFRVATEVIDFYRAKARLEGKSLSRELAETVTQIYLQEQGKRCARRAA